ncbi:unnamed protein product, partial [Brassica oleracea]
NPEEKDYKIHTLAFERKTGREYKMATRGAAAAFVIWKHRNNPSLRSISSHHFYPIFKPQIIPKGCRYQIRAIQGESVDRGTQSKNNDEPKPKPENWKIKMLYDGDCPLCMREVNMLKERNEEYGTIKFVDISSNDYSPQENQGLDYKTVMGQIHAIQSEGNVVTGVEAFRKLYELVGLGWVYSITKFEPIGKVADAVYDFWAKYRLQVTGRPPIEAILEAREKNKVGRKRTSQSAFVLWLFFLNLYSKKETEEIIFVGRWRHVVTVRRARRDFSYKLHIPHPVCSYICSVCPHYINLSVSMY